ncbi:acetyl-CoA carboxylase [Candidatus Halocynthiibacter alkanivorans]|uniref:acetyl-CoA carboxylase n=1 Tax=Candidatus Halocynthiibacter alkanivorans TaxID=2267619 RepID=UPI000DF3F552|nr:acetyl-CoA carboxylase [Candidatus Halocynthiibacter alkanivorans]
MAVIQSPLPGIFYHKPTPEDPPFRLTGDDVAVGDTIGLVEVMKTFIEIKSEIPGKFEGYAIADGSPVTAGETLAELSD